MTTPVQQAREALGARLREIRKDADLTARATQPLLVGTWAAAGV